MVMEVSRADGCADDNAEKSGDKQLEMLLRTGMYAKKSPISPIKEPYATSKETY